MALDPGREAWLVAGATAGYLLLMAANPVRSSLRDGRRCLRRYPRIWLLTAAFALAHAAFNFAVRAYEIWTIPAAGPVIATWTGWQPPAWGEVAAASWLPTGESTAAVFNCIATTFPLSTLGAVLFLVNWRGAHATLVRALRRRFGSGIGTAIHLGCELSAAAAVAKPFVFLGLQRLNLYAGSEALERWGEIVNWLSFGFEYLLGVGVQIYLSLLCYVWLRGLTFDFDALRRFALRRWVSVFKWALVVMTISSLGISLPLVIATFQAPDRVWDARSVILVTRALLVGLLVVLCALQPLLIFHNESLGRAFSDQLRFWRRYGWHVGWLVLTIAVHFFVLAAADALVPSSLGGWTWPGAIWRLALHPLLWSGLASWFLLSWVCLFRRCERRQPDLQELVRY